MNTTPLIFVIEDDPGVAQLIGRTLAQHGYASRRYAHGREALNELTRLRPALCIVDLGLPDMDGIELLKAIARTHDCALLIVTGRDHPRDKVMGLELGADDYVTKPFDERELVARIRSVMRRHHPSDRPPTAADVKSVARFMGWQYDVTSNALTEPNGHTHFLGTAEAQVLRVFLEKPHHILNREHLLGQRDISPLDRSIDVRISRIRRKIEHDPKNPKIIKTVYGSGYMFTAPVEWNTA